MNITNGTVEVDGKVYDETGVRKLRDRKAELEAALRETRHRLAGGIASIQSGCGVDSWVASTEAYLRDSQ